jgi:hypothetical protein
MTKLHGMTETIQFDESLDQLYDSADASIENAVIHGMTETLHVAEAGTKELDAFPPSFPNGRSSAQSMADVEAKALSFVRRHRKAVAAAVFMAGMIAGVARHLAGRTAKRR